MTTKKSEFPLLIKISFSKLFEKYEAGLSSSNELTRERAQRVLDIAAAYPKLSEGFLNEKEVLKNQNQVDLVLEIFFHRCYRR
jgi:hypothetical protein